MVRSHPGLVLLLALAAPAMSNGQAQKATVELTRPLPMNPPSSCTALPDVDEHVEIVDVARLRFVHDPKLDIYRSYSGRCSTRGIEDIQLREGAPFKGDLKWNQANVALISGDPFGPGEYGLGAGPDLKLKGPGKLSNLRIDLGPAKGGREGVGVRTVASPLAVRQGRSTIDLMSVRVVAEADTANRVRVVDVFQITYRLSAALTNLTESQPATIR